jgi:hypothetical protein
MSSAVLNNLMRFPIGLYTIDILPFIVPIANIRPHDMYPTHFIGLHPALDTALLNSYIAATDKINTAIAKVSTEIITAANNKAKPSTALITLVFNIIFPHIFFLCSDNHI